MSLLRVLEKPDRWQVLSILRAYTLRFLEPDEMRDIYLVFFPWPEIDASDWLRGN